MYIKAEVFIVIVDIGRLICVIKALTCLLAHPNQPDKSIFSCFSTELQNNDCFQTSFLNTTFVANWSETQPSSAPKIMLVV